MQEYYNFESTKNKLNGSSLIQESFVEGAEPGSGLTMSSNISTSNLTLARKQLIGNPEYDFSSKVSNPNSLGYTTALREVRNDDAKEIIEQQTTIFSLAAVAGVSLIVVGLLITSASNASQ